MTQAAPAAFFSYSREDSDFALKLAGDLKAAGASVWLDQLDIRPGDRWDRTVEDALTNCTRMVVILSPASVNSTNVMDEVSFALEEKKTVIPVIYRDCTVPFRLRRVQRVDFRQDYGPGLQELLKILAPGKTGAQSSPAISDLGSQSQASASGADERQRAAEQERVEEERRKSAEQAVRTTLEGREVEHATHKKLPHTGRIGVISTAKFGPLRIGTSVRESWWISLLVALVSMGLLVVDIYNGKKLPATVQNLIYYILLLISALFCSIALFGILRTKVHAAFTRIGVVVESSGAAALFMLIVYVGIAAKGSNTFDLTVRARGAENSVITSGKIAIDLGTNRREVAIGSNGEANFKRIPSEFAGQKIKVLPHVDGYEENWQELQIADNFIEITLAKAHSEAALQGTVLQVFPVKSNRDVLLRRDPSTSSPVLEHLGKGVRLTLVDTTPESGFYHVRTEDDQIGWVLSSNITVSPPENLVQPENSVMPLSSLAGKCDPNLWNHVYHAYRLIVKQQCIDVTGTIVDATAAEELKPPDGVRHEHDGDARGWLKVDPAFQNLLNAGNMRDEGGNLVFEIVCRFPVTQNEAKAACQGYQDNLQLPKVGSRVRIVGSYVQDTFNAQWNEIHPVTSITVIH